MATTQNGDAKLLAEIRVNTKIWHAAKAGLDACNVKQCELTRQKDEAEREISRLTWELNQALGVPRYEQTMSSYR